MGDIGIEQAHYEVLPIEADELVVAQPVPEAPRHDAPAEPVPSR